MTISFARSIFQLLRYKLLVIKSYIIVIVYYHTARLRMRDFFFSFFSFQDLFSWVRRGFIFSAIPPLNISSVPGFQLQDATRLVGIQSRMAFYKCKFLIKVRVGLQIRKEAKFPQCRSSLQRTSDGRGPGWNGR